MLRNRSKQPCYLLGWIVAVALVACGGQEAQDRRDTSGSTASEASIDSPLAEEKSSVSSPPASSDAHPRLGRPLEHPQSYYGLYASPDSPDRQWFVTAAKRPKYAEQAPEVPPGYLEIGAMFGDVAPWHMKTISATEFEQAWVGEHQPEPITVVFELASDGQATAMTFTNESYDFLGRLERVGDLPDDWQ